MKSDPVLIELIKEYRKTLGMTQEEFAAEIGVNADHISAVERGLRGISLEKLIEIRRKFHISLDGLLPDEDFDDSIRQRWIADITEDLQALNTTQVGVLRQMIRSMKD